MTKNRSSKSDLIFAIILTGCYLALAVLILLKHEMWRDELEPWMIAKQSGTFAALFHNMRYEGHPVLWYILLYGITRFFTTPEPMQYANLLLATASIYLLARYAPLSRKNILLFAIGFYPLYQYAIISRGYALCMLLLFAFCVMYPVRRRKLPVLALLLILLSNADVYGWFFCAALSVALAVSWLSDRRSGVSWSVKPTVVILCGLLVAAGMLVSLKLSAPPADGGWYAAWFTAFQWKRLLLVLYGFTFELNYGPRLLYLPASLALLLWFTASFHRKPIVRIAWMTYLLSLFVFYYTKFLPFYWHKGMVLMFLVACIWISSDEEDCALSCKWLDRLTLRAHRSSGAILSCILVFFVVYGAKWIVDDIKRPYSTTQMAASFLVSNSMQDSLIVGDADFVVQSVSAYIDRPIYYPASGSVGTFVVWNNSRHWPLGKDELSQRISQARAASKTPVLLVLNYELSPADCATISAKLLRSFSNSVKVEENLWIYQVKQNKPGKISGS